MFAVPGSIFSRQSHGTNQLIRESTAKLVATPDQLCEELNLLGARAPQRPLPLPGIDPAVPAAGTVPPAARTAVPVPAVPPKPAISATPEEGKILHWLQDEPRHVDEIARASGLPVALVSSTLQVMELKGMVRQQRPLVYGIA
ncbi:MAG: hypothetical protein IT303_15870 [Dehalococcoidia bacterium]|nr:hypothetical protein [Dehalococcoidia bacterium]